MNHAQKKRMMQLKRVNDAIDQGHRESFREYLLDLHPFDQFVLFKEITKQQRHFLYEWLSVEEVAEFIRYFEPEDRMKSYFDEMTPTFAAAVIGAMPSDDATDILQKLPKSQKELYLKLLEQRDRAQLVDALSHEQESAGGIMTSEMVMLEVHWSVQEAIAIVIDQAPVADLIYVLYVIDEYDRLIGVLSLRDLLVAKPEQTVGEVMSRDVITVNETTDQEVAAKLMQDYNLLALPVIDENEHLRGIITIDDAMDVLSKEYEEDFLIIQGINTNVTTAGILASIRSRYLWSFGVMLSAVAVTILLSQFVGVIARLPQLVLFLPLISVVGSASGNQSLAVVLLALDRDQHHWSLREGFQMLGTQLLISLPIALGLSVMVGVVAYSISQNLAFSGLVSAVILMAILLSNLLAVVIPIILVRLKRNPQIITSTAINVSVDLIMFATYFSCAIWLSGQGWI